MKTTGSSQVRPPKALELQGEILGGPPITLVSGLVCTSRESSRRVAVGFLRERRSPDRTVRTGENKGADRVIGVPGMRSQHPTTVCIPNAKRAIWTSTMIVSTLLVLAAVEFQAQVEEDNLQLARTVLARFTDNLNKMTDYSFVFEGEYRHRDPRAPGVRTDFSPHAGHGHGHGPISFDMNYQGVYAFRVADVAVALDLYEQHLDAKMPMHRNTDALVGHRLEQLEQTPDNDKESLVPRKTVGSYFSLNGPRSPQRFVLFGLLRHAALDPVGWDFRITGWEDLDGRRCAVAEMNQFHEMTRPDRPMLKLWIDLERGALPLKLEVHRGDLVTLKTTDIGLEQFKLPGGDSVWFPVKGTTRIFSLSTGETPTATYFEEVAYVIRSSLKFNRNLSDSDFSIRSGSRIFTLSKSLVSDRRFEEARKAEARPTLRTDRESVERTLASRLAEANAQSKELEASSAAEEVIGTGTVQLLMCVVGVGLLGIVAFRKWRAA